MSDSTVILNAHLPLQPKDYYSKDYSEPYQITIQNNLVHSIEPMAAAQVISSCSTVIDVKGDWISLGAVDLQINGALGLAFVDLSPSQLGKLHAICEFLWQQGIDGFCPTLVTTSLENIHSSLSAIRTFQAQQNQSTEHGSAKILGVHLEGPFLNRAKRGAHPEEYLQPLTLEALKTVIGDLLPTVRIMTLAPEIEMGTGVIEWLKNRDITVSLGHSLATAGQANAAFSRGASMVTHAFNAMPPLHHRQPGLLGAALTHPGVFCGFIADGQHICPTVLNVLMRINRGRLGSLADDLNGGLNGGLFLVSDALAPLGLPDGVYPWDTRQIEVIEGTARLADGTLSGTTLPLIEGAKNLVKWGFCTVAEAIALVSQTPRQAIGLPTFEVGSPAQLLRWHLDADNPHLQWQRLKI